MEREYFSHDYTARHDIKVKRLIAKHGMAGYGIYWSLVEDLYINYNDLPTDYESIAFDLRCDTAIVKSVLNDFGLFIVKKDSFKSESVGRRLDIRNTKSDKARGAAKKRWSGIVPMQTHSERIPNAMQTHSDGNAIKKERKKERKEGDFISEIPEQKQPQRSAFQFDPNLNDGSGQMYWSHFGHYISDGCPDEPFDDSFDDDIFDRDKFRWAIGVFCQHGRAIGSEDQCKHLAKQMKAENYQLAHAASVIINFRATGRMERLTAKEMKFYHHGNSGIDI
jgi:hypothetical protein